MTNYKHVALILSAGILMGSCGMSNTAKGGMIGGGSGAALGALIGGLAGNGKGAAIGAAVGAAVGTGAGVLIGKKMDKAAEEAAKIENAQVEQVTDNNGLQAVKVTFASGILFSTSSSTLSASAKSSLTDLYTRYFFGIKYDPSRHQLKVKNDDGGFDGITKGLGYAEVIVDVNLIIHIVPEDESLFDFILKGLKNPYVYPALGRHEDILRIDNVSIVETENNTLLITFTDETTKEIPLDLEDITDIYSTYKPNENTTTVTIETNKNKYEFNVNDPLGISNITNSVDGTTGNILLEINMTDGTKKEIIIPKGEKGDTGLGIESIVTEDSENEYILHITYTDGTTEQFNFNKPNITSWYSGVGAPMFIMNAKDGDFYFDTANFKFYQYNAMQLSWVLIADLGIAGDKCVVTFNAVKNGGEIISGNPSIECSRGDYISLGSIPIAYKAGYEFIGWYTDPNASSNVNAEKFTDLTPVMSNLELFACFIEK